MTSTSEKYVLKLAQIWTSQMSVCNIFIFSELVTAKVKLLLFFPHFAKFFFECVCSMALEMVLFSNEPLTMSHRKCSFEVLPRRRWKIKSLYLWCDAKNRMRMKNESILWCLLLNPPHRRSRAVSIKIAAKKIMKFSSFCQSKIFLVFTAFFRSIKDSNSNSVMRTDLPHPTIIITARGTVFIKLPQWFHLSLGFYCLNVTDKKLDTRRQLKVLWEERVNDFTVLINWLYYFTKNILSS
jgi:hypothetical protein